MAQSNFNLDDFILGPAVVEFDGATFLSSSGLRIRIVPEISTEESDCLADIKSMTDVTTTIEFTPEGFWGNLGVLYSILALEPGEVCPQKQLVVRSKAGKSFSFPCASISVPPSLTLGSGKRAFGSMTFKAYRSGDDWSVNDSIVSVGGGAGSAGNQNLENLIKQCYQGSYGGLGVFDTVDGFTVNFRAQKNECRTDCAGLVGETLKSLEIEASANVVGPNCSAVIAAMGIQGNGAAKGRILDGLGGNLTITGENGVGGITLFGAELVGGAEFAFGKNEKGGGNLTWRACGAGGTYPLASV